MTSQADLGPGTRLGRYEIRDALGSGGMGHVYRATDMRLGRTVALKILGADPSTSPVRRARFEREARAVSQLNHPHVCTLYDIGEDGGVSFLVMEYLEGETLARRLERGPLPLSQALQHGIEICSALAHAHRHGLVHRDVKPSNVFLTPIGAKLLDFGIAKSHARPGTAGDETLLQLGATLTVDGALVGTVQYMSPEQLEGFPTDWRTDVFAVGLVLYEMVAGRPAGRSAASVIARVLSGEPEPLHIPDLRITRACDATLARCLAKKPEERWQSLEDLRGELQWMLEARRGDRETTSPPIRQLRIAITPHSSGFSRNRQRGIHSSSSEHSRRSRRTDDFWRLSLPATSRTVSCGCDHSTRPSHGRCPIPRVPPARSGLPTVNRLRSSPRAR